ncbi:carboxymuconolactone decarboxylase family protein [Amycolatopsis keratiniphila]|uniref:Alkylhydroperoxidase n=1 Tax=Amycolatopsis keratiniphila subsp. keratiniphila TaxID=227715 RepID=A0A1W2LWA4_9PSEU|nr:carboxymuconolactone decarboxylase family protein [Amycolatopsis keratiniphila]ONF70741.1 alkylhydroperoxidase [Amycolatopsis keratiniphila subsp. keratiniphila]
MNARLDYFANPVGGKFMRPLISAGRGLADSPLPLTIQELVRMRASQINGCAVCLDIHTKEAAAAGETDVRINLVAVWREASVFSEAERAALEVTEQACRMADGGVVTDEAWANAAKHFDEDQLAALVGVISLINAFNRVNAIVQNPGGDYRAGQFA